MKQNHRALWVIVMALTLSGVAVWADSQTQQQAAESPAYLQEPFANPPDTRLPNVLLIGDSISIGYTVTVRRLLEGKADVFRPDTNCGHTGMGIEKIREWVGERHWDVIHFNFGIWDSHYLRNGEMVTAMKPSAEELKEVQLRYTTDQYLENLRRILGVLKETKAVLIWATTTPVTSWDEARQAALREKNVAAERLMRKEGVRIDDLSGLVLPHVQAWQMEDGCHFGPEGCTELGKQVAASISAALGAK